MPEAGHSLVYNYFRIYFEEYVVSEWLESKIFPVKVKVIILINAIQSLKARRTWERPVKELIHFFKLTASY